jgi:DNA-binding LacI/PurR family transcriptional regulator
MTSGRKLGQAPRRSGGANQDGQGELPDAASLPTGPVTLRHIAQATGVSVNTVSRALTGKSDVNAATKARVQAAAERLGYQPNLPARSLVLGRTRSLGLVVSDCTNPFYAMLIRAVENVAYSNGYSLLLATSNETVEREAAALQMLRERRIDGLLLSPVAVEAPHLRPLLAGRLPCVLLTRRPTGYKGPFVGTDNTRAAELATRYLLDLGHRRIAHVTLSDGGISARARMEGYRRQLARAGLSPAERIELAAAQTIEGGRAAARRLLAHENRPSAVFTFNDLQAVGVLLGLRDAGIKVPAEMSVVGFDGIDIGEVVSPPLTTMSQPIDEIGRVGAQILIDALAGRPQRRQHVLPATLVVRGSTGPLRDQPRSADRRMARTP